MRSKQFSLSACFRAFTRAHPAVLCAVVCLAWSGAANAQAPANEVAPRLVIETGTHSAPLRRLAVSPQRNLVVTTSDDKSARIWNLASGALMHVLRPGVGSGDIGRLYGAAIHPRDDVVAIGGTTGSGGAAHRILFFSPTTGEFLRSHDARGSDIKNLAWSADGTVLLASYAGDHAIRAFDERGEQVYARPLSAPSFGLATSSAGMAAATSMDGSVILLDARNGQVHETRVVRTRGEEPVGAAFSPDGSRLLIGFHQQKAAPELLNAITGKSVGRIAVPSVRVGNFISVAWSMDGSLLVAAGSAHDSPRRYDAFFFDAASGRLIGRLPVASDTVLDLEALPDGRFAYGSFDGSWGVVSPQATVLRVGASVPDVRSPERLLISADAREVQWSFEGEQRTMTFSFSKRLAVPGPGGGHLSPPRSSSGWTDSSEWRDVRAPKIRGTSVKLATEEWSRALAYFSDRPAALLGTSQRLIHLDENGTVRWQVRTPGEVRAVNLSTDNRVAVTAMSDGSLRWWRTRDGSLLLSLLVIHDGRWVAWTESGFFDAGAGADSLAGWAVNRPDAPTADFYSLGRFRERFNRADVVDRVLQTLEPVAGLEPPLPPVLEMTGPLGPAPNDSTIVIPYLVRRSDGSTFAVDVRVDGRPVLDANVEQLLAGDGKSRGQVRMSRPSPGSVVQLFARNVHGVSEPVGFIQQASTLPKAEAGTYSIQAASTAAQGPAGVAELPATSAAEADRREEPAMPVGPMPEPAVSGVVASASPARIPLVPLKVTMAASSGNSSPPPLLTSSPDTPAGPRQPRLFVLAIGISRYKNPDYHLGLAAKDAGDFSNAMQGQTGRLYSEVIVRTLTDERATRGSVIEHLHWLSANVGPKDIGVMFFAGHGINSADGQYYFLAHDAHHLQLAKTGIPELELRNALGRMRGKALLFVDTCFGGAALSRAGSSELARLANNLSAAENGIVVFASSSGRQLSEENDSWGNGAFTKAVIAGLSGKADYNGTGRVTFKGLDFYVSAEVGRLTEGRQTPVTISPTGVPDFALALVGAS